MIDEHNARMLAENLRITALDTQKEQTRPSVLFRPVLSLDGDKWCALYGDNIQVGLAGFGETPEEAMREFDERWQQGYNDSHQGQE